MTTQPILGLDTIIPKQRKLNEDFDRQEILQAHQEATIRRFELKLIPL
ncbi:MAG: hypothetical protein LBF80_05860 [Spirochaetaceae bacterium]|nr:hypothetical protein [Spirochaetaceae bacterium]